MSESRSKRLKHRKPGGRSEAGGKNIVMGRNACAETLEHRANTVKTIYMAGDLKGAHRLKRLIEEVSCEVRRVNPDRLTEMCASSSHQSVALELSDRIFCSLNDLIKRSESSPHSLVLALDSIFDPHNFGAILRAAECFGVKGVIWSNNRGAGITPVVTKVSVGASELVNLAPVGNLANALKKLKAAGYWIVAADVGPNAQSLNHFELPDKAVLLFGSEGAGISSLLSKQSDYTVRISMTGKIDSLNVSQAVAVCLYALSRSG